jgi:phage terminase large subunit-like protein
VQPLLEGKHIVFDEDFDESFIRELVKFPNIDHDDRVDSFTALILYHKQFLMKIEAENQKQED